MNGATFVTSIPDGHYVVSMIEHQGVIYVATNRMVFMLRDDSLVPVHFCVDWSTMGPEKEPRIECGVTGSPGPGEDNCVDRHMI